MGRGSPSEATTPAPGSEATATAMVPATEIRPDPHAGRQAGAVVKTAPLLLLMALEGPSCRPLGLLGKVDRSLRPRGLVRQGTSRPGRRQLVVGLTGQLPGSAAGVRTRGL